MNFDIEYVFNAEKNLQLKEKRGISFEEIIYHIENGQLLDILLHPNKEKYRQQKIYVVDVEGYVFLVPFKQEKNHIYLITIYPSRKYTREYLKKAVKH